MPACHISMPHQDAGMLICWHRSASGCLHAAPECRTAGGMPCRLRIEERGATQCAQPNSHTLVSGSQIAPGFPFHNLSQQVSLQCIDSPKPLCRYVAPLELVQRQSTSLHQSSAEEEASKCCRQASIVRSSHQELVRVPAHGVCVLAAAHVMPQPLG